MYYTHFLSNENNKIKQYKIYSNKLNKIKITNKRNYYNAQFTKCKNNLKATWKIIGTLIKRKSKGMQYPAKLIKNNCSYTNKRDIANQLNQHFVTVGPNLANSLPKSNDDPLQVYTQFSSI